MTSFGRIETRAEDSALLDGSERFVDDQPAARDALHLTVLRSDFAHARVRLGSMKPSGDVALSLGPADVTDLRWPQLLPDLPPLGPLAAGRARYVGEPLAAVVAGSVRAGRAALESVDVDYDVLPAAASPDRALAADAPLVYQELGTNVVYTDESSGPRYRTQTGDIAIERRFTIPRIAPGMLECRAFLAEPDDGGLLVYAGHQNAHKLRDELADVLGLHPGSVRVIVPAVGGGFGAKSSFYPEYALAARAALELGRPVKYIETRTENLLLTAHGRGQQQHAILHARPSGRLVALEVEVDADFGAAADIQRWCVALTRRMLSGAYRIPKIRWRMRGVLTHTPPVGAFRGAGRPEAAYLIERLMDELARDLDVDPVELRRQNFIEPDQFPYGSPTAVTYDSGNYRAALDAAVDHGGYVGWVAERDRRRAAGGSRHLGIGIASTVEMTAGGGEFGAVEIDDRGAVTLLTGTSPHGQGHRTAWAQLAADELGVEYDTVDLRFGDTGAVPRGGGTSGSRSASLGGSAIHLAAGAMAERLRHLAASALEAAPGDIRLAGGRAVVAGTDVGVDFGTLARSSPSRTLSEEKDFSAPGQTFPFGSVMCVVEVDTETGEAAIVAFTSVDDCGRVINPLLVEGQIAGGMLQGVSAALNEAALFDEQGGPLTTNLTSYHLPAAREAPKATALRTETPSPNNPLGVKGVGELGTTGAMPAVANAVADALAGIGVDVSALQVPFTASRVWAAITGSAA